MGWLARCFGQCGTVRYEFQLQDGSTGIGKTYIEAFNIDNDELTEKLKDIVHVKTGKRPCKLEIKAFAEGGNVE